MAGTSTVRSYLTVVDFGTFAPLSAEFQVTGIDADNYQSRTLAATTAEALYFGAVSVTTTSPFLWLRLISGGSTRVTGLDLCLSTDSWADADANIILLSGQSICIPVQLATLSVKNLNSSACTYEYAICGDSA